MDNIYYLEPSNSTEINHPYVNSLVSTLSEMSFPKDICDSVSKRYAKLWQRAIFSDQPMIFITGNENSVNLYVLKVEDGQYVEKHFEMPSNTSDLDGIAALLLAVHFIATSEKAYIDLGLIQCFTDINVFGNYNAMRDVLENTGEIIDCNDNPYVK